MQSDFFKVSVDHVSDATIDATLAANAKDNKCAAEFASSEELHKFVHASVMNSRASQRFTLTNNVGSLSTAVATAERFADGSLSVIIDARCARIV